MCRSSGFVLSWYFIFFLCVSQIPSIWSSWLFLARKCMHINCSILMHNDFHMCNVDCLFKYIERTLTKKDICMFRRVFFFSTCMRWRKTFLASVQCYLSPSEHCFSNGNSHLHTDRESIERKREREREEEDKIHYYLVCSMFNCARLNVCFFFRCKKNNRSQLNLAK